MTNEHNGNVSVDKTKRQSHPVEHHPDGSNNQQGLVDHFTTSPERLIRLAPFPFLDTDPTLKNLNAAIAAPSKTAKLIGYDKQRFVIQPPQNSRPREENVRDVDRKNTDRSNFSTIKKSDAHPRKLPVLRTRKVIPAISPKHLIAANVAQNKTGSFSVVHGQLQNQKEPPADIPNQKTLAKESSTVTQELAAEVKDNSVDDNGAASKTESTYKTDVEIEQERIKPADQNATKLIRVQKKADIYRNKNVVGTSLESAFESSRHNIKSPAEQKFYKSMEHDFYNTTEKSTGLAFNSLFIGCIKQKEPYEIHPSLRSSLFSNMPPYIKFCSHEVKGQSFPLPLQNVLKWKLSSITPNVIRHTIQNSGFKLVRSDHNLDTSTTVDASSSITSNPTGATSSELLMLPRTLSVDCVGTWGRHMKSVFFKTLCEEQKLNHFPGTFEIGRKDRLWRNLHKMIMKHGEHVFGFIPTSFVLPQEVRLLRQVWRENDDLKWIVKPPASARGAGIRVISKWNQIPKKVPLVVQTYIDNPYLINDTKFDLRLYILITSINPLQLYLYDNGLVRFASVKYSSDVSTISDRYRHLTNYSINRLSSEYSQNEDADACQGHKWTLRSFWTYMKNERKADVNTLWKSLADLVVKTVISGESPMSQMCRLNLNNRYNAYELFGIDVLFDENFKPWILEVNISPSLHTSSQLDLAVKGPLIRDIMNMAGYHIPSKISQSAHRTIHKMLGLHTPLCHETRVYTLKLSKKEQEKQNFFTNVKCREEYINEILSNLLPCDVRYLITYEDELTQIGSFIKIFPTTETYTYHEYFEAPRYYNRLLDAWECRYSARREKGIAVLEEFCAAQFHLEEPIVEEDTQN